MLNVAGKKGGGRKTHSGRGKGKITHKIKGDRVKQFGGNAAPLFAKKAKSSEPDNVGRKVRPAAHNSKQAGVAKRARKQVRRLSEQAI